MAIDDTVGAFVPGPRLERPPLGAGRLSGLRFAVKDLFDIAGAGTTYGNPDWAGTHATATATAPEATVSGGQPHIRVTRRRIRTEAVQSSSLPPALPPTPERGKKPTLRIAPPRSKITGT